MKENFVPCLPKTLKWEGGYSNHPDDPGGATMRGVTQGNYNSWRKRTGKPVQAVSKITNEEVQAIYRGDYWDAVACDTLPAGVDYAVFDLAVNNGVGRAKQFLAQAIKTTDGSPAALINSVCDQRLVFDRRLRIWGVFGKGWTARIAGVRADALTMAKAKPTPAAKDGAPLRVGMIGPAVKALQTKLRDKGYPAGNVDGIFGNTTKRAVILFQTENKLPVTGIWLPAYGAKLDNAAPVNPARQSTTETDLHAAGDKVTAIHRLMKTLLAWLGFGGGATEAVNHSDTLPGMLEHAHGVIAPLAGAVHWAGDHKGLLIAVACGALFIAVRYLSHRRVGDFKSFNLQGAK